MGRAPQRHTVRSFSFWGHIFLFCCCATSPTWFFGGGGDRWWRGPSKYPCHACLARTIGADAENRQIARVRERERWVACVRSNGKLNIGALCFSVSISYSLSAYLTFYRLLISLIRRMPMCRTEAGQRRKKNHRGRDESWKWELMLVVCVPTLMVCVCVWPRAAQRTTSRTMMILFVKVCAHSARGHLKNIGGPGVIALAELRKTFSTISCPITPNSMNGTKRCAAHKIPAPEYRSILLDGWVGNAEYCNILRRISTHNNHITEQMHVAWRTRGRPSARVPLLRIRALSVAVAIWKVSGI